MDKRLSNFLGKMPITFQHMERCSVLPEIQEMQVKTTLGLHLLPIRQV